MPINVLKGTWSRLLEADRLRRSSQVLSVIDQTVCIFGGEVQPRQPVDDKIDVFSLKPGTFPRQAFTNMVLGLSQIQMHQISRQSRCQKHPAHVLALRRR
jgi:hypothetical protein